MRKLAIVGGTGYTGAELLRLLAGHGHAEVSVLTSRKEAGMRADELFPALRGHSNAVFTAPDMATLAECDGVFFATPHGVALAQAPELMAKGVKVVDLSADFRLKNPASYQHWYGQPHTAPEALAEAVYGIPEFNRAALTQARLAAGPGCYPTCVQLGLAPLLEQGLIETQGIIADCKSGVSGAGREAKIGSLYCETAEGMKAYGVGGHRHQPEIEQGLALRAGGPVGLTFIPHLIPMSRGMLASLYVRLTAPLSQAQLSAVYAQRYAGEPFIDILPPGHSPDTRSVRGANTCRIAPTLMADGRTVLVLSAIDNLVKGAAGQALQCMNLMLGLPETAGLSAAPL